MRGWLCALVLLATGAQADEVIPRAPFVDAPGVQEVAFLARSVGGAERYVLEGSDLDTAHRPWSTFKIPNLLIALEIGVADGPNALRTWDSSRHPAGRWWPDAWLQDHTLATAFRASAVWYFRDVATEVGSDRYRDWLARWDYGNADPGEGRDDFWLGGPLEISVAGQVAFLESLLSGTAGVAPEHLEILAEISAEPDHAGLHAKTGAGPLVPGNLAGPFGGWYVGWQVREGAAPLAFALYMEAESFAALRDLRRDLAVTLLEAIAE
ncbi:class D beta-lactamase [Pontivivens ytuae]|uniref:Class D beta-lactamase n=1 Tax=Pontivivens ytuae TaxID=2789856 RepID=A0A7S9LQ02_9RHOB|nr:class D beta-lactamase [Pontivivens ytuae]QPH53169.1 class D beta-lactamase [Pontivivens ytuae]